MVGYISFQWLITFLKIFPFKVIVKSGYGSVEIGNLPFKGESSNIHLCFVVSALKIRHKKHSGDLGKE